MIIYLTQNKIELEYITKLMIELAPSFYEQYIQMLSSWVLTSTMSNVEYNVEYIITFDF